MPDLVLESSAWRGLEAALLREARQHPVSPDDLAADAVRLVELTRAFGVTKESAATRVPRRDDA